MLETAPVRADTLDREMTESCARRETGTELANYSNRNSCSLDLRDTAEKRAWGGARNRLDRVSDGLNDSDVEAIIAAAQFAMMTGRTFQRHWIIHYGKAGIADADATRFISRLLHIVGKQARRAGGALTALWVRETASPKGGHVHILLHLPAGMSLRNRTRRWIEAAGGKCIATVSKIKVIGGRLARGPDAHSAHYRHNAENVTRYLLKACSVETGERLQLEKNGQGGRIIGKRRGWTQNIGSRARTLLTNVDLPASNIEGEVH